MNDYHPVEPATAATPTCRWNRATFLFVMFVNLFAESLCSRKYEDNRVRAQCNGFFQQGSQCTMQFIECKECFGLHITWIVFRKDLFELLKVVINRYSYCRFWSRWYYALFWSVLKKYIYWLFKRNKINIQ